MPKFVTERPNKVDIENPTIEIYRQKLAQAIVDEHNATNIYDELLQFDGVPMFVRGVIREIRQDELEHKRLLALLLSKLEELVNDSTPEQNLVNLISNRTTLGAIYRVPNDGDGDADDNYEDNDDRREE